MRFEFTENTKTISNIYRMFNKEELIIDNTYQRRSVWIEKDKIRLIETILLNFVVPSVYFWQSDTNPETGDSITHIVDGQQRIKAVMDFIDNKFCLKGSALLEDSLIDEYSGKYFVDLSDEDKKKIWNYKFFVIEIDLNANKKDIINMFSRLNLTEYTLNDQEKRNTIRGLFHELAYELSLNDFWKQIDFFTTNDMKRMKDIQFNASIILLWRNGIIEQSNSSAAINRAYEEFKEEYPSMNHDKNSIIKAMEMILELNEGKGIDKFIKKKTQIYSIFSICFYMIRKNMKINNEIKNKFEVFVKIYNQYKNEEIVDLQLNDEENKVYDLFKKYKQASSEGVNKLSNRVARFDVLKKFLLEYNYSNEITDSLYEKLRKS
ncbi:MULTISPECIES: DUF262 domain-containing protein [Bacillus]|uniref:DUF262 domain-containing protein n=1 Tax=Bacillus TaxID=1386 RepID=UPI001010BC31|nr:MULTISPECIES: DUF262 domain-containing protein [Bacillus]MDL5613782.1 DUF262 domain-containing protein [Bacillus halotolerans]MEC0277368.1 DUF262 domain-containing protein [Bacillus halotolerans]UQE79744.1 DUF262 domain-containing protein [Bacillus cabrialesii]